MPLVRRRIRVSRVYRGPLLGRERSMKLLREHAVEAIVSLTFACQHTFTSYPFPFIAHQPGSPCKHITSYAHHAPMSRYFPALTDFHTHVFPSQFISPICSYAFLLTIFHIYPYPAHIHDHQTQGSHFHITNIFFTFSLPVTALPHPSHAFTMG